MFVTGLIMWWNRVVRPQEKALRKPSAMSKTRMPLGAGGVAVAGVFVALTVLVPSVMAQPARSRPETPPLSDPSPRLVEPRVAPLPEAEWTPAHRAIAELYDPLGSTGNVLGTLFRAPELAKSVQPFLRYTSLDSSLPPRHRAMVILRTAWLSQNAALWANHVAHAQTAGLTSEDLHQIAIGPGTDGWEAFESRLLTFVDELFINSSVTDDTWAAVSAEYDVYNMVDAVMTVAEFTTLSVLLNSLGVQADATVPWALPTDVAYRAAVSDREPPRTTPRIDPIEGQGLNVTRTIARHPQVSELWGGNTDYVNRRSPLRPHDRELLILRIGWNCQAEYEWAKHVGSVGRARDHGLEPRWIAEGPESPRWEPYEVALLTAADEMYRDAMMSDETWTELASYYDTHEMMSIVMTVATYRFVSMTLNAFGVQLAADDEGFPEL